MIALPITLFLCLCLVFVVYETVDEYFKLKELRKDYEQIWTEIHKVESVIFEDKSQNNYEQAN